MVQRDVCTCTETKGPMNIAPRKRGRILRRPRVLFALHTIRDQYSTMVSLTASPLTSRYTRVQQSDKHVQHLEGETHLVLNNRVADGVPLYVTVLDDGVADSISLGTTLHPGCNSQIDKRSTEGEQHTLYSTIVWLTASPFTSRYSTMVSLIASPSVPRYIQVVTVRSIDTALKESNIPCSR